jgi:formylglycine-generating enzyme
MDVRRPTLRAGLAAVALGSVAACAAIVGVDDLEIGECKGGFCVDGGRSDGDDDPQIEPDGSVLDASFVDARAPCLGEAGPAAVRVGPPSNSFCIDGTEVSFGHYRAFLEAGVDASAQGPECAWNTSFAPSAALADDLPVTGVDWCDAVAYCAWAGKYLCGKAVNGKKVGAVAPSEVGDYGVHQWLIACSAQTNRYPYGSIQDPTACNVGENDAGKALPVGSKPECEGSYPGVFDMVGNVWEWFDGPCLADGGLGGDAGDAGPAADECWVKGGGYGNRGANIDCRVDGLGSRRDMKAAFIGIRCCSD